MKKATPDPIIQRIIKLRKQYSGERGRRKFANALGLSASTYSYYEYDRIPPADVLTKICEITGAAPSWLLTGQDFKEKSNFGLAFAGNNFANTEILQKLNDLLTENPALAGPVSAFIELLSEKSSLEKKVRLPVAKAVSIPEMGVSSKIPDSADRNIATQKSRSGAKRSGWIPVLGRTAAGIVHYWDETFLSDSDRAVTELEDLVRKHIGKDILGRTDGLVSVDLQAKPLLEGAKGAQADLVQVGGDEAGEILEFVQCERIFEMFPDSFALRVDGDSMSPRINDGDIVILSPSVPAVQGSIAVAHAADQIGVTCKLIRTTGKSVHLIPINEKYETKVVSQSDLSWALAVLCHVKA